MSSTFRGGRSPDAFKPPRDRHVSPRTVVCSDCGADLGEPCRSAVTGKPLGKAHAARRRMAVRLQNEDL